MKIDESRNRVEDMLCNLRDGYINHLIYGGKGDAETEADIHALEEVTAALDWYREQDLIRREDAIHHITRDCNACAVRIYHKMQKIPKAEPHCAFCDYSAIDDYYLCAMCEYKDEKTNMKV